MGHMGGVLRHMWGDTGVHGAHGGSTEAHVEDTGVHGEE